MKDHYDVVIVGGGIVGLASALMLCQRHPTIRMAILEKEEKVAQHQTSHNSGVIHSGVYYKPGSLKARLCTDGGKRMTAFCDSHGIRNQAIGKLIVATAEHEVSALQELHRRGTANGVPGLRCVDPRELVAIEPHATGVAALWVPITSIVDYAEVARAMAFDLQTQGVTIITGQAVKKVDPRGGELIVQTVTRQITASYLVNCAGLYSDTIARMMGISTQVQIVPFRGEYYLLKPERRHLIRGLVYPVPDPELPFLGVHFTRMVHGDVEAGPNAVLALAREGYTHTIVRPREFVGTLAYPGFWLMARQFWRTGLSEFQRSFDKGRFVRSLQRLIPEIQAEDLVRGRAGVRAQAVSRDGRLIDDFVIQQSHRAIHVLNAPSPAATASLAIGGYVADVATRELGIVSA